MIARLEQGESVIPEHDLLVMTFPCVDMTGLKQMLQYRDTPTKDLFQQQQLKLSKLLPSSYRLVEMVAPTSAMASD